MCLTNEHNYFLAGFLPAAGFPPFLANLLAFLAAALPLGNGSNGLLI